MKDASPVATGEMWECPQYVELSGRRLLTISPDIPEERGAIYFLGDERDGQFNPESVAAFDLGPDFHAAALVQDPSGRLLCWAWSPEATAHATQVEAGWQGVLTLPREVSLASDGSLAIVPARELEALRGIRHSVRGLVVPADGSYRAPVEADAAEIDLVLDVGAAEEVAIAVLASARAEEETRIVYRRARDEVAIDRERSSERDDVRGGRHGGRLGRRPGERVHLRIFVDRSIVEAFANNRRTITSRVYPRRPDSRGIVVTAAGDAAVIERLDVWPVDPQEQWAPVY
jgi:beta-fructofuranosidase